MIETDTPITPIEIAPRPENGRKLTAPQLQEAFHVISERALKAWNLTSQNSKRLVLIGAMAALFIFSGCGTQSEAEPQSVLPSCGIDQTIGYIRHIDVLQPLNGGYTFARVVSAPDNNPGGCGVIVHGKIPSVGYGTITTGSNSLSVSGEGNYPYVVSSIYKSPTAGCAASNIIVSESAITDNWYQDPTTIPNSNIDLNPIVISYNGKLCTAYIPQNLEDELDFDSRQKILIVFDSQQGINDEPVVKSITKV